MSNKYKFKKCLRVGNHVRMSLINNDTCSNNLLHKITFLIHKQYISAESQICHRLAKKKSVIDMGDKVGLACFP